MYLLLIFLPLIGSISAGLFGRNLGSFGAQIITVSCLILDFLISLFLFYEVALSNSPVYIKLMVWIDSELFNVDWGFLFDTLTVTMCCVVTFISSLVHIYSTEYMSHDPHLPRFMSYLSLFTFFMLILVTADNYVQMFVGWEGVGLCSYLLINFWYTRIQANKAAIKAMIVNRVGDFGLALGIFTIFVNYKAVDYSTVFSLTPFFVNDSFVFLNFEINLLSLIGFLLFVGAVGKSAQLGLHTWLPDAMEGPTPVSALIHAATMVTAGVFLIARSSVIFEYAPFILNIVTVIGACTAFFAATVGLLQNDLKKVIAYSTCSQLGYMIFACGLSNYSVGIFHLTNHAFFKALLFLGAGSIIHAIADEQDIRKMGGFKNLLPFAYAITLIGSLALIGFPFLSGFYSKDVILENAYAHYNTAGVYIFWLGLFGAMCTAFYSTRLLLLVFLTKTKTYRIVLLNIHEGHFALFIPLFFLTVFSIFAGFMSMDFFTGFGTDYWNNVIFIIPQNYFLYDIEFIDFYKGLPLLFVCFGVIIAIICCSILNKMFYTLKTTTVFKSIYNFLIKKWYFDRLYNELVGQPLLMFSYFFAYKNLDRGFIEIFGPTSITDILYNGTMFVKDIQSGYIYHYVNFFILGLLSILLFVVGFSFFFTKIIFILNLIVMLILSESVVDYLTKY